MFIPGSRTKLTRPLTWKPTSSFFQDSTEPATSDRRLGSLRFRVT